MDPMYNEVLRLPDHREDLVTTLTSLLEYHVLTGTDCHYFCLPGKPSPGELFSKRQAVSNLPGRKLSSWLSS